MKVLGPLTTMAILAVPSTALAWAPEDPTKAFTLTVSPIHLIMETGEFTGEFALAKKHGLAAIAGIGVPNGQEIIELGASYRYYVLGNFDRGMQVGGELLLAGEIDAEVHDGCRVHHRRSAWRRDHRGGDRSAPQPQPGLVVRQQGIAQASLVHRKCPPVTSW
jgi:hypothetical protein